MHTLFIAAAPIRHRRAPGAVPFRRRRRRHVARTAPACKLIRPQRYSSDDWLKSLASLPTSLILKRVLPRLVPNFVVCSATTVAYQAYTDFFPDAHFGVSSLPHTFLATLLSLVLVFRSNAAYSKFDEGRKLWGQLINLTRGIGRLASVALPSHHARVVGSLACLFPYVATCVSRGTHTDFAP